MGVFHFEMDYLSKQRDLRDGKPCRDISLLVTEAGELSASVLTRLHSHCVLDLFSARTFAERTGKILWSLLSHLIARE
jgi:hypothetical protein